MYHHTDGRKVHIENTASYIKDLKNCKLVSTAETGFFVRYALQADAVLARAAICGATDSERLCRELHPYIVTVQPAPFVKPHCVLIVASATVLLIKWRSAHQEWSGSILMQA